MKRSVLKSLSAGLLMLPLVLSFCACSCSCDDDAPKDTELEVTYVATGESIREYQMCEFVYDGRPKIFTAKIKLSDSGVYLQDSDFEDRNWKQHLKLWVLGADGAYTDKKIYNWETDWPTQTGRYDLRLDFNDLDPRNPVKNDKKFYSTRFFFTLIIKEE